MARFEKYFMRLQNGNDVRGAAIATESEERTLTEGLVTFIANAFTAFLAEKLGKAVSDLRIGIGHDSRVTADVLMAAAIRGLGDAEVYDCGLITTPAMFQSTILHKSDFDGSVMLTASHLPFNRNGMKFFTKEGSLEKKQLTEILGRASACAEASGREDAEQFVSAEALPAPARAAVPFDMAGVYAEAMKQIICEAVAAEDRLHPLKGLKIIVDAGNGASGFFAEQILKPLGADISGSVFLNPDGHFPNHVPNPEDGAAMEAARSATVTAGADLGVIFDCDGDRGAVVFADGTEVNRNTLIGLLSAIVAESAPGSTVVTDSVTSDELTEFLEKKLGLKHLRFKRGYKNVIDKGIELNAAGERCELAIETSGHGAFKENHFSDDGAYISVKIIIKMAQLMREGKSIESLIADMKSPAESREVRFRITAEDFRAVGEKVLADFRQMAESKGWHIVEPNYEGIRIAFDDSEVKGWVLLRMSLHDPVLPMNLEAGTKGCTDIILSRLEPFFAAYPELTR